MRQIELETFSDVLFFMERHGIGKEDAASIAKQVFQWGVSAAMDRMRPSRPQPADLPPVAAPEGEQALFAESPKPKRRAPAMAKRRIPEDFILTPERAAYARDRGFGNAQLVADMFEDFRNYYLKTGKCWSDWDAVWRTWVGNQVKRSNNSGPHHDPGSFL